MRWGGWGSRRYRGSDARSARGPRCHGRHEVHTGVDIRPRAAARNADHTARRVALPPGPNTTVLPLPLGRRRPRRHPHRDVHEPRARPPGALAVDEADVRLAGPPARPGPPLPQLGPRAEDAADVGPPRLLG